MRKNILSELSKNLKYEVSTGMMPITNLVYQQGNQDKWKNMATFCCCY